MGADYYIYTVLKIVHTTGIELIKLHEEPMYLHYFEDDVDDMLIHPLKRRPKIDHMKPKTQDVRIYKKGENDKGAYFDGLLNYEHGDHRIIHKI